MGINKISIAAIKDEFVTSLMNYYKIEESINLREHIADLVSAIKPSEYREFFRRLSSMSVDYKNGFEKIAIVVKEFENERISPLIADASTRASRLYEIMYQIKRDISDKRDKNSSDIEVFESLNLHTIKMDDKNLFDEIDLKAISSVGLGWIYNHVSFDRALFESRMVSEYKRLLLESISTNILLTQKQKALGQ